MRRLDAANYLLVPLEDLVLCTTLSHGMFQAFELEHGSVMTSAALPHNAPS